MLGTVPSTTMMMMMLLAGKEDKLDGDVFGSKKVSMQAEHSNSGVVGTQVRDESIKQDELFAGGQCEQDRRSKTTGKMYAYNFMQI